MGTKPYRQPNAGRAVEIHRRARAQAQKVREAVQFERCAAARMNALSRRGLYGIHGPGPLHVMAAPDKGAATDGIDPPPS
jgi:hypothetical protein